MWIVAFTLAGMLFVIPTAGKAPIVQAMLALGVGVGPAAAMLMVLPPVSVPSLAMLWRSMLWRSVSERPAGSDGSMPPSCQQA